MLTFHSSPADVCSPMCNITCAKLTKFRHICLINVLMSSTLELLLTSPNGNTNTVLVMMPCSSNIKYMQCWQYLNTWSLFVEWTTPRITFGQSKRAVYIIFIFLFVTSSLLIEQKKAQIYMFMINIQVRIRIRRIVMTV